MEEALVLDMTDIKLDVKENPKLDKEEKKEEEKELEQKEEEQKEEKEEDKSHEGGEDRKDRESGDGHEEPTQEPEQHFEQIDFLDVEGKVRKLQTDFKDIPRYLIRKVLQRPDVHEDLERARSCLKKMGDDNEKAHNEELEVEARGRGRGRGGRGGRGRGEGGGRGERGGRGGGGGGRGERGGRGGRGGRVFKKDFFTPRNWNRNENIHPRDGNGGNQYDFQDGQGDNRGHGGWRRGGGRGRGNFRGRPISAGDKGGEGLVREEANKEQGKDNSTKCKGSEKSGDESANQKKKETTLQEKEKENTFDENHEETEKFEVNQGNRGGKRGRRNRNKQRKQGNFHEDEGNGGMYGSSDSLHFDSNQSVPPRGGRQQGKGRGNWDRRIRKTDPGHPGPFYGEYGPYGFYPPPPPPGAYFQPGYPPPFPPYYHDPYAGRPHTENRALYHERGGIGPTGGLPFGAEQGAECDIFDDNKLMVHGVNEACKHDNLRNYLEIITQDEVLDITPLGDGNFLIKLDKISDFEKAQQKCRNRPLTGSQVSLERIAVSFGVCVRGISSETTSDGLESYFGNPKRGGDVKELQFVKGQENAVIYFVGKEAVQKVLSQTHVVLDGATLIVEPYRPFLQPGDDEKYQRPMGREHPPLQPSTRASDHPMPQSLSVQVNQEIMEFVRQTKHLRELMDSLKEMGFGFEYKRGSSTVTLTEEHPASTDNHGVAADIVTTMVNRFDRFEMVIESELWKPVTQALPQIREEWGRQHVVFKEDETSSKVSVICLRSEKANLKESFQKKVEDIQDKERRKTFTKTVLDKEHIDEEKLVLLTKISFIEEIETEFPDTKIEIDLESNEMRIESPKDQFGQAIKIIYKKIFKMDRRDLSLSTNVVELLSTDDALKRLKEEMAKRKIEAVFSVDEGEEKAFVIGTSSAHAENAAGMIRGLTKEVKINVDKGNENMLATKGWNAVCDDVKTKFHVHVRRNKWNETWFTGFKEDIAKAEARAKMYLDEHTTNTERYQCPSAIIRRYITENRMAEVKVMEDKLKDYSVKIKAGTADDEILITGAKEGIKRAREVIHLLTTNIATKAMQISQPGLKKFFADGQGDRLIRSVEHDHHCAIVVEKNFPRGSPVAAARSDQSASDSSVESDDSNGEEETAVVGGASGNSVSIGKARISWKLGNIVTEKADVLVSATVGQLLKIFCASAGPQLQNSLSIAKPAGSVTVTQGFGLPCSHVMHGNCPRWDQGNGGSEMSLKSIVQTCLTKTDQLGMKSIAFPIIGTGGLSFPHDIACRTMLNAAVEYCTGNPNTSVTHIRFVIYAQDQNLVAAFQKEFTTIMASQSSPSQFTRRRSPFLFSMLRPSSAGSHASIGAARIEVIQGNIVNEQTEAIVNINHPSMKMQSAGELSKAVLQAAGQGLQDECSMMGPQPAGSAVVTNGCGLRVGHIVHMVPGSCDKGHLQTCLENCLRKADGTGFQSLSIPSVGTGSFGISDVDSADVTFKALNKVCPNLQNLQHIRVVIFKGQMLPAFMQELQKHSIVQSAATFPKQVTAASRKPQPKPRAALTRSTASSSTSPVASAKLQIFGKTNSSVGDAEKDLMKGFSDVCTTQEIKDQTVSKFSPSQRLKLERKAAQKDVTIKFEDANDRVVIRGGASDVLALSQEFWKEIQECKDKLKNKEQAAVLYQTVRWQYTLNGLTAAFDKLSNASLEKASSTHESRVTVKLRDEDFVIVLGTKTGTGAASGRTIDLSRNTVGASSSGTSGLPSTWVPMPMDSSGKESTVHLVSLTAGSEYQKIHSQFTSTGGQGHIIKIERVQNPHIYRGYMVKKAKMDRDNGGGNNERTLFHGTNSKNVDAINTQGFNRSFCGANGTAYGNGVYFAQNASYSMGYASTSSSGMYGNYRHMYVARVLVGQYTPGRSGLLTPPSKNPSRPEILYDSVDDGRGSIFVVFHDSQCYPEYLITFQ